MTGGSVRSRLRDERASAGDAVHKTVLNETLHGRARSHPRDAELVAQLRFRGKRRVWHEPGGAPSQRLFDLEVAGDELAHASAAQWVG